MQDPREAFVIWLEEEPKQPAPGCTGWVEHVRSATRGRFRDAEELLAFLAAHRRGEAPDEP